MASKPKSNVFDQDLYGVFLRSARQRAGYNRAEDFCRIVTEWIGIPINKEALYRIEKGVQAPTVEQLIGFGLVLHHGKGMPDVLNRTELLRCTTPYAEYLSGFKGPITSAITYCGTELDSANSDDTHHEFTAPDEGTPGLDAVDEYYLDEKGWAQLVG